MGAKIDLLGLRLILFIVSLCLSAFLAQLVEQLIRNE